MGKTSAVRKEVREEILQKVRNGMSVRETAEQHGVSTTAIYHWMRDRAGGEKSDLLELSRLKRENEALSQIVGRMTYLQNIQNLGKKS